MSSISVSNSQAWQINRPITFTFTIAVDFDTVNLNTISIRQANGIQAVGDFFPGTDPRSVIFQPVCPALADFSDAGFLPGGTGYTINLPTSATGLTTLMSAGGTALSSSFPSSFTTPNSSILADLFLDSVPGAAEAVTDPTLGTSVVLGSGSGAQETFFEQDSGPMGNGVLPAGMSVPNNFYSDASTRVIVNLRLNQPVNPRAENINTNRIKLQFQAFGATNENEGWQDLSIGVELVSNCTGTGAWVRITPVGLLPQARDLRVVITPEFEDLVGERSPDPQVRFATMTTGAATDAGGGFVETGDAFTENYLDSSFQDSVSALAMPQAAWGADNIAAAFNFTGDGGPNGEFDLHITTDVIFNTVLFQFSGGPGGFPSVFHAAHGGRLNVRNLVINEDATLRIQGPNAAEILCTGDLVVNGLIRINGTNAKSVFTLNTPTQIEAGAAGQGGGGGGGDGSFLTSQVTPFGGMGRGPYNASGGGGFGGESSWSTSTGGPVRRAAGGGGGRLGHAQKLEYSPGPGSYLCPDQERIGLDPESGFPGSITALSSQGPHTAWGGRMGPSPFANTVTQNDDFWGTKIMNIGGVDPQLVVGELQEIRPGSGGGGGGDSTRILPGGSYPPSELVNGHQDKGAGGGGGAGGLRIMVLGDVVFGPKGHIEAVGGHGNGGENTGWTNRIGGGSGGGSGGHIVIHTAGQIDFSQVQMNSGVPVLYPVLDAKGGQGGEGGGISSGSSSGNGGAFEGETVVGKDGVHATNTNALVSPPPGPNGGPWWVNVENPWIYDDNDVEHIPSECVIGAGLPANIFHAQGAGGDGGPGLIQLHVGRLYAEGAGEPSDFVYPDDEGDLRRLSSPVPHGYNEFNDKWDDHLLPAFGRFSGSQSKWIPLGEPSQDPQSATPQPIEFLFEGTDASGFVITASDEVIAQGSLLTEANVVVDSTDPLAPLVLMDGSEFGLAGNEAKRIYWANPGLLLDFRLMVDSVAYSVTSASYDEGTSMFTFGVASPSIGLNSATGQVDLIPRDFSVRTFHPAQNAGDVVHGPHTEFEPDELLDEQSIKLEFELMYEPHAGGPAETTGFSGDLNSLTSGIDQTQNKIRFIRYRMTFDMGTGDLGFDTVRPSMEFLKLPFRF